MRSNEALTLKGGVIFLDGAEWAFQCFCSLERSWETGRDFSLLISYSAAVPVRLLHLWHNYCKHLRKLNLAQRQVNRNTNAHKHTHANYTLSHIHTHKIKFLQEHRNQRVFYWAIQESHYVPCRVQNADVIKNRWNNSNAGAQSSIYKQESLTSTGSLFSLIIPRLPRVIISTQSQCWTNQPVKIHSQLKETIFSVYEQRWEKKTWCFTAFNHTHPHRVLFLLIYNWCALLIFCFISNREVCAEIKFKFWHTWLAKKRKWTI